MTAFFHSFLAIHCHAEPFDAAQGRLREASQRRPLHFLVFTVRCFTSGNMARYFTFWCVGVSRFARNTYTKDFVCAAVCTKREQQRTPISQATLVDLKRWR